MVSSYEIPHNTMPHSTCSKFRTVLDEFRGTFVNLRQPNLRPYKPWKPNEGPKPLSGGRGTGGLSPPCPPAVRFPNRSGTAPRSSSSGTMRYPTAWCAEIRPRPTRSTPPISPTGRKPRPPPRARGHPCTPPAAFRAPSLRPFALNPLGAIAFDRVHVRTTRWIAASGGSRGSAALTAPFYSPAPLVEPLVSRSATRNFPPRSHPNRFQPALDARSTSLIPCTQSCKRSRLKKFFSPGRACCSDCLKVRRPPRPDMEYDTAPRIGLESDSMVWYKCYETPKGPHDN